MTNLDLEQRQQQWKKRIQNQKESGLTIQKWCQENQIGVSSFYKWQARLSLKKPSLNPKASFVELKPTIKYRLTLDYEGINFQLEVTSLKQALPILEKLACS